MALCENKRPPPLLPLLAQLPLGCLPLPHWLQLLPHCTWPAYFGDGVISWGASWQCLHRAMAANAQAHTRTESGQAEAPDWPPLLLPPPPLPVASCRCRAWLLLSPLLPLLLLPGQPTRRWCRPGGCVWLPLPPLPLLLLLPASLLGHAVVRQGVQSVHPPLVVSPDRRLHAHKLLCKGGCGVWGRRDTGVTEWWGEVGCGGGETRG